jgi:diacylglycerol O-acyltransferase-1
MTTRTGAIASAREESQLNSRKGVQNETEVALPSTSTAKKRSKYRHVAAYHSESRPSSLSREADVLPNFLGFRNLMVLVLGKGRQGILYANG